MPFTVTRVRNWKQRLGKILEGQQRVLWYFWKRPIAIEHKTYTALRATSMANHTAGFPDERRRKLCRADKAANRKLDWCSPTRLAIGRCNGAFCCYCSHTIDVHFKRRKKIISLLLLLWIIVISKGRQSLAFRIQFDTNIYIFMGSRVGWAMRIDHDQTSVLTNHLKAEFLSCKVSVKY